MANYKLEITKTAQKSLKSLDKQILERLIAKIEKLKLEPFPAGFKKLVGNSSYRIRVGDYRVIYSVLEDLVLIKVLKVGHRKDVYS